MAGFRNQNAMRRQRAVDQPLLVGELQRLGELPKGRRRRAGRRRQLWFRYAEMIGRLASGQPADYFDLGVSRGIAAVRGRQLRAGPAVRRFADSLVREALGANAPREHVAAAAIVAASALVTRNDGSVPPF